jgi:hypothetical protein
MRSFRRGDRVVLRTAVRRSRWHKYGRVRVRKGASGRVTQRHIKLLKAPRYDVEFRRGGRSKSVRKLPAGSLRRPRSPLLVVLVVLVLLLIIGYLAQLQR